MASAELTGLGAALRQLVNDLRDSGVRFALVGGLAVSVRAEPRLTRDADVAVSVADDAQAETVIHRMIATGYRPDAVLEQDAAGRLATVRLGHPGHRGILLDLLFASCGIEREIVESAEELEALPGLFIPVARTGHLVAMKLLARDDRRRPADADDLRALSLISDSDEWKLARRAVGLITERGYGRGRDLDAALAELMSAVGRRTDGAE